MLICLHMTYKELLSAHFFRLMFGMWQRLLKVHDRWQWLPTVAANSDTPTVTANGNCYQWSPTVTVDGDHQQWLLQWLLQWLPTVTTNSNCLLMKPNLTVLSGSWEHSAGLISSLEQRESHGLVSLMESHPVHLPSLQFPQSRWCCSMSWHAMAVYPVPCVSRHSNSRPTSQPTSPRRNTRYWH